MLVNLWQGVWHIEVSRLYFVVLFLSDSFVHCRSAEWADAQVIRAAVLLDELAPSPPPFTPGVAPVVSHVVAEIKTVECLPLLQYACSSRVVALPTSQLYARKL